MKRQRRQVCPGLPKGTGSNSPEGGNGSILPRSRELVGLGLESRKPPVRPLFRVVDPLDLLGLPSHGTPSPHYRKESGWVDNGGPRCIGLKTDLEICR